MNKYVQWGVIGFEVMLIVSLLQGIGKSSEAGERVEKLAAEKTELLEARGELLSRLEYVQSPEYLEKVARDELNLAKPEETVVIVPDSELSGTGSSDQEAVIGQDKPNYLKWWEVLSGKM